MSGEARMLSHQQATAFYDRLGTKQDWQAFYEVPATANLIAHAAFEEAQSVFECGCGTGAFAERLLSRHLPPQARYLADAYQGFPILAGMKKRSFPSRLQKITSYEENSAWTRQHSHSLQTRP